MAAIAVVGMYGKVSRFAFLVEPPMGPLRSLWCMILPNAEALCATWSTTIVGTAGLVS